ncbi:MAG: hypothetical protein QNK63_08645 [Flavobacteriales bacterium]
MKKLIYFVSFSSAEIITNFCTFAWKFLVMNLNSILRGIGELLTWTFDTVLVPLGHLPNYAFIAVGVFGLFLWLSMQQKYNKKAKSNGTLK